MTNYRFKILVVDDDLNNIQVGINFLKKNDQYHLVFATSGEQALERVMETKFDLILLDILMPIMNGFEVCRRLKENDKTKHIPIIFLTAKDDEESLVKGFELGGADYITKPFNAPELHARVKTHLDLHYYYQNEIRKFQKVAVYSQKMETIRFVASGIGHDCNNFMAPIPGSLYLLEKYMQEHGVPGEKYADLSQGIYTAVKKVTGLLEKLSNYSRWDEGHCGVVDMNEVVSDLRKVFRGYERHKITFESEVKHQPARTFADQLHIEQVLMNILLNAQNAILARKGDNLEKGCINLTIDTCSGDEHSELRDGKMYLDMTIKDNGTGMSSEVLEQIYEPYFTTHKEFGGTGLGLAVSQGIVQSYHGEIIAKSEPGKGTVFSVYLPLYQR